jgi:hypothetical protein
MSWGYRVTILTLGFVCFMSFLVVSAFRQDFDLVAEDYYGKELKFQSQIDKQLNQQKLKDSLTCVVSDNNVIIKFSDELIGKKIEGEIFFFRPSDKKKDFKIPIVSSNGLQVVTKESFSKGRYLVQLDYTVDGKKYYEEKSIMIQ